MTDQTLTEPAANAEAIRWNLSALYTGLDDPAITADLDRADGLAAALQETYKGRIHTLGATGVAALITAYEEALTVAYAPYQFAWMTWTTDSENPTVGRLMSRVNERYARFTQETVFIKLELAALPPEAFEALIAAPELADRKHWLEVIALERPYLLSEPEEKLLTEKAVTGVEAWVRLFDETNAATRFDYDGQTLTMEEVLDKLHEADQATRKRGWQVMTTGLRGNLRLMTFIFNQVLADKASDDRLRGYETWVQRRNVKNEVDDAAVEALIAAVTGRYDIVQRYYRLKRDLLGVDELFDYDRYAPLPAAERSYTWHEARDIVLGSFEAFHPRVREVAARFFDEGWIDAAVYPGKQGGAYCSDVVHRLGHPFVFMSYQGKIGDVQTLAHELGHGMHGVFAAQQGPILADTPMTTAETASTFAEMLVFNRLMAEQNDPAVRLAMLADKLESSFATIFRQISMNRFEHALHTTRRQEGELPADRINALWLNTQREMFGDSVTITDEYGLWWSYIWHFVGAPGYVYAYAFGELLVLALYARYQAQPEGFAEAYIAALEAGGSDWPHAIMANLGVDLTDPTFWQEGLNILDTLVSEAEDLARQLG